MLGSVASAVLPSVLSLLQGVGKKAATRLWNSLNSGERFHPIRQWPEWAQKAQLSAAAGGTGRHGGLLANKDRFGLFHFLAANGLDPGVASEHVLAGDARSIARGGLKLGWQLLKHSGYADKAERHVAQMIQQATSGDMFRLPKKYMSMHLGRVVNSKEHEEVLQRVLFGKRGGRAVLSRSNHA